MVGCWWVDVLYLGMCNIWAGLVVDCLRCQFLPLIESPDLGKVEQKNFWKEIPAAILLYKGIL